MMVFGKAPKHKPKKKSKIAPTNVAKKYKVEFTPLVVSSTKHSWRVADDTPSAPIVGSANQQTPVKYEGEMLERELAAQKEIERKKKFVAPMHKSNYIYVGGEANTDTKGWGRKTEIL